MFELYDDEENLVASHLIRKPMLCLVCRVDRVGNGMDEILCTMNRNDQQDNEAFHCEAFELDACARSGAA